MSEYLAAVPSIIFLIVVIAVNIILLRQCVLLQDHIKRSQDLPWKDLIRISIRIIGATLLMTVGCWVTQFIGLLISTESVSMQNLLKVSTWFAVVFLLYQLLILAIFVIMGLYLKTLIRNEIL